jgi:hypothetical protein
MSISSFMSSLEADADPLTLEAAKANPDWPWLAWGSSVWVCLLGPFVTNLATKPVGHKLIFTKKRNAQRQVIRYKVRLLSQGFIQRPGVGYTSSYSLVMDSTTFRYLLGMAVQRMLETQLLDVVRSYLYGPLDTKFYIKPPPNFFSKPIPANTSKSYSGLKIQRALYGLKQAR